TSGRCLCHSTPGGRDDAERVAADLPRIRGSEGRGSGRSQHGAGEQAVTEVVVTLDLRSLPFFGRLRMVACPHGDPIGVKPVSRESRERLARAAIEYALRGREEVLRAA